ncbi:acyl-CoA dehydrogenase family protein [Sphingomonas sanxanigenens]|nr:acyl-CoA dehydrogenase family protein [Sphingomonas sanxanigenens]
MIEHTGLETDRSRLAGGAEDRSVDEVQLLEKIDLLAAEIISRAGEAETDRHLPSSIMAELGAAGLYRATVPKSHGGLELPLPIIVRILERLSKLDGSLGWISHVRFLAPLGLALLPRERFDAIMSGGPDIVGAAVTQPTGTAEATDGGWRITGRWPFASGFDDADIVALHCVVTEGGDPLPSTRLIYAPTRDLQREDSWHALGLKATASHHIVANNVMVNAADAIDLATARSSLPGPLYSGIFQISTLFHCPMALGVAQAAVDDLVDLAQGGRRQFGAATQLKDSETFLFELGKAQAALRAAQAFTDTEARRIWEQAQAGVLSSGLPEAKILQSAIWVTQTCLQVVQSCFSLAGGAAVYSTSSLQRRLRDIQTMAQHVNVHHRHYVEAGRALIQTQGV